MTIDKHLTQRLRKDISLIANQQLNFFLATVFNFFFFELIAFGLNICIQSIMMNLYKLYFLKF